MAEKLSSGVSRVSAAVIEASRLLRVLAEPPSIGDTIKAQLSRAARRIPFWSYRRVKAVWYGEVHSIDADDLEALRALAKQKMKAAEDAACDEYSTLVARIQRLERYLASQDADFHRPEIDGLRVAIDGSRRVGRSVDRQE